MFGRRRPHHRLLGAVAMLLASTAAAVALPQAAAARSDQPPPRIPGEYELIEQYTTPAGQVAAGEATVGIVGDSIAWDYSGSIARTVRASMPIAHNEVILGARIRHHYYRTVEAVRARDGPGALVVILGTAESNHGPSSAEFAHDMRVFLDDVVPHVDCVRWLDTQVADASGIYAEFNTHHERLSAVIHQVAAEYPTVEYYHYGAWTEIAPPGYIDVDHLHLARDGRVELGRMIVQAAKGCDPATDVAGFWDVKAGYWAGDAISWITEEGLASGYPNRSYRAVIGGLSLSVTRAQLAGMVWRLMGSTPATGSHRWTDGPDWVQGALDWLAEAGLADGHPDGTFRPDADISRGEVLRMLWRIAGSPTATAAHAWLDSRPWIDLALDWAAEQGLLSGYADGTVRPDAAISRAEIARLLFRFESLPAAAPGSTPNESPPAGSPPAEPPASTTVPTTTVTDGPVTDEPVTDDPVPPVSSSTTTEAPAVNEPLG